MKNRNDDIPKPGGDLGPSSSDRLAALASCFRLKRDLEIDFKYDCKRRPRVAGFFYPTYCEELKERLRAQKAECNLVERQARFWEVARGESEASAESRGKKTFTLASVTTPWVEKDKWNYLISAIDASMERDDAKFRYKARCPLPGLSLFSPTCDKLKAKWKVREDLSDQVNTVIKTPGGK